MSSSFPVCTKPRCGAATLTEEEREKRPGVRMLVDCDCIHNTWEMGYDTIKRHQVECEFHFKITVERDQEDGSMITRRIHDIAFTEEGMDHVRTLITDLADEDLSHPLYVYVCSRLYSEYFKDNLCYQGTQSREKQIIRIMWE